MSNRTEQVKAHVTPETKRELEREAETRDLSISQLANEYIERGLRQDREDELSAETRAAQQLRDTIDRGLDEFEQIARDMREMQARSGAHTVATFELLKQDYPEQRIQQAFRTGRDRLREDVDPADVTDDIPDSRDDSEDQGGFWDD